LYYKHKNIGMAIISTANNDPTQIVIIVLINSPVYSVLKEKSNEFRTNEIAISKVI